MPKDRLVSENEGGNLIIFDCDKRRKNYVILEISKEKAKRIGKFVYTTTEAGDITHKCVTVADKKRAVTYCYGGDKNLRPKQKGKLYNMMEVKITVLFKCLII